MGLFEALREGIEGFGKGVDDRLSLYEYTDHLIKIALLEDVGRGDVTTDAIVPSHTTGRACIIAKEDLVVAGLFVAERVFKAVDRAIEFRGLVREGSSVKKGRRIAVVAGPLRGILTGERTALNFLQRLSGIATLTREFVRKVKGTGVRILDTRKTTPCMRLLERYAVRVGGGFNHRFGLFDRILVKDNHITVAGGVAEAVRRVRGVYPDMDIEVEVRSLREVREAIKSRVNIIMLDNMKIEKIRRAKEIIGRNALVEVSGGVGLDNVRAIAEKGVDFVSIGTLTHSARAVDMSMEVIDHGKGCRG